jgi:hypothetical protein
VHDLGNYGSARQAIAHLNCSNKTAVSIGAFSNVTIGTRTVLLKLMEKVARAG